MAIDDRIGKWDFFKQVTGHDYWDTGDSWRAKFPGDIPDFEIPEERVDEIYLLAKKMQRCYYPPDGRDTSEYYTAAISRIEEAYVGENLDAFRIAVQGLVAAISEE